MKKLFKILPVVAAAVPLTTVPFVTTSCKTDKYEDFKYVFDDTHKAKDFEPKDSLGHVKLHADEVTTTFLKNVNENKQILADTIVYGIINDFFYYEDQAGADLFTQAQGTIDVSIGSVNYKNSRCTFKYSLNLTVGEENYKATVDFYNVPFSIYWWHEPESNDAYWCFAPVYTMMARPYDIGDPTRNNIYNSYLRYVNDWKLYMNASQLFTDWHDDVELEIGSESGLIIKNLLYTNLCLFGHSFNKINYLKDIEIQE